MAWLPWHVELTDAPCTCMDSRWDVVTEADGCTTQYRCRYCNGLIADLICGAEP